MTIANDAWIRRMALEKGMITPFQEGLVSKGTISYGLSSYGYDVRVAKNFKIFHNLNSTLVDPKKFDDRSFIDHVGDSCIIPPNSFVLAETVERFRIPRDVLCVCLGKCLTGDTRVVDADTGDYLPIRDFAGRRHTVAWQDAAIVRRRVTSFIPQGRKPVFRVTTRAGVEIRATANHPFLTEEGWTALSRLRPGDRVAGAGYIPVFGTERLASFEDAVASILREERIDPRFFRLRRGDLATLLRAVFTEYGRIEDGDKGVAVTYYARSKAFLEELRHLLLRFGVFALVRPYWHDCNERWISRLEIAWADDILRFADAIGFLAGSEAQQRLRESVVPGIRRRARRRLTAVAAALGSGREVREAHVPSPSAGTATPEPTDVVWDIVDSIVPAGEEEVFDLTVPGPDCFVANDLVVHNSTYARCFTGDTRVALVDGTSPTLEEMARRAEGGEAFFGYSMGGDGRVRATLLDRPRWIARDAVLEVVLDSGTPIRCTPDHELFRRDGTLVRAHDLRPGDSLMPLYRESVHGAEFVYEPLDGGRTATEDLVRAWSARNGLGAPFVPRLRRGRHDERVDAVAARLRTEAPVARALPAFPARPFATNHRVESIRALSGERDVYCLTVPEAGNFALEAGVFVKNCGIIVNVTPLEPEWEGIVTIEISNTTPLPAKIYANEGIAQILFLRAAPDGICETSYGDRKGKYQNQGGLTLPKISST